MIEISEQIKGLIGYLAETREKLHALAEVSLKEFLTQKFIVSELEAMECKPRLVETGVLCDILSADAKHITALRCDIDALPIAECTDRAVKSNNPKTMHACGHDGHTAMLLGVAKLLTKVKLHKNTRLIFQYAEETNGGAEKMIEAGCLEGVDEIFALHLCPELEIGKIASTSDAMFAGKVEFAIEVFGTSAHCADPLKGRDALKAAAWIYSQFEGIKGKRKNTLTFCGSMHAGTSFNVVADYAELKCTIRYFNNNDANFIMGKIRDMLVEADNTFATMHKLNVRAAYPPLVNTAAGLKALKSVVEIEKCLPRYTAEDFAFYLQKTDGCMAWLGCKSSYREYYPLHSNMFDFDNATLCNGLEVFYRLLTRNRFASIR